MQKLRYVTILVYIKINIYVYIYIHIEKLYLFHACKFVCEHVYIYIYTYAHVCPDMRNNFCLHLCQKCESSIFPTTCKTGNVFPVSHILPHKVLYKQTKRSEINKKK